MSVPNKGLKRGEYYWAKEKGGLNGEWSPIYLDLQGFWWPRNCMGWYDDIEVYDEYAILKEVLTRPKSDA